MTPNKNKLLRSLATWLFPFALFWSTLLFGAVDSWSLNSPQGGIIQTFAIDPLAANIIYAGTATNGIYKSTDGGANWTRISQGLNNLSVQAIAIDPLNTNLILAGTQGGGVFRSTNGGTSWTAINNGLLNLNVYSIIFDQADPTKMYAGTFGNVFVSTGRNATSSVTWLPQGRGQGLTENAIQTVVADPNNVDTFYVGTYAGGVYTSTDNMDRWTEVSTGLDPLNVRNLLLSSTGTLYAGTQGGGFFVGTPNNGGVSWVKRSTGLINNFINVIVESNDDPNVLYVATANNVYKTTDAGISWAAVSSDLSGLRVLALAIDHNTTPETIYAGTPQGVYKLTDGNTTWTASSSGISALNISGIALDSGTPNTQYVATYGSGVLKTTDAGASWQYVNAGLSDLYINAITLDGSNIYVGTQFAGAFKSINGASSWTMTAGLGTALVTHIVDDTSTSDRLYAASDAGINITSNGGAAWAKINGDIGDQHDTKVQALAIDPASAGERRVYLSMKSSGIFYSRIGTSVWQNSSVGLTNEFIYAIAIDPDNPNTLYVGTRGKGVFKSTDRGASWVAINSGLAPDATNDVVHVNALAIDPNDNDTLYAGTESFGVYRSLDGGDSWSEVTGLANYKINTLAVHPDSATLYAGTASSGVYAIDFSISNAANLNNIADASPGESKNSDGGSGSSDYLILLFIALITLCRFKLQRRINTPVY